MNDERYFYVVVGSDIEKHMLDLISKVGVKCSVELGELFGYFGAETGEVVNRYIISESDRKKVGDYIRKTRSSK